MSNAKPITKVQWVFIIGLIISVTLMLRAMDDTPQSGLPSVYDTAKECVTAHLFYPDTAKYPEYEEGMVVYNSSVLEDIGEGYGCLEYRIYDVKSSVYAVNQIGQSGKADFFVQVYVYVDDYPSAQYGEQGIHKGVKDHYCSYLRSLE